MVHFMGQEFLIMFMFEDVKYRWQKDMFYGAKPQIFENAQFLRKNMTDGEMLLWNELKNNKLGVRFKAQHPVDVFILDFYCHKLKLAVEIDGEIHNNQTEYDEGRTFELNNLGINVVRFTNKQVLSEMNLVLDKIKSFLK